VFVTRVVATGMAPKVVGTKRGEHNSGGAVFVLGSD